MYNFKEALLEWSNSPAVLGEWPSLQLMKRGAITGNIAIRITEGPGRGRSGGGGGGHPLGERHLGLNAAPSWSSGAIFLFV